MNRQGRRRDPTRTGSVEQDDRINRRHPQQQPQHQSAMSLNKKQSKLSLLLNQQSWIHTILIPILTHAIAITAYLVPLMAHYPHYEAVLDEMHIFANTNKDVTGESLLIDVFTNDYWGRPMSKNDSHKSWRPFSVLTFRWLRQNLGSGAGVLTQQHHWYGMAFRHEVLVARYVQQL